MSNLSLEDVQLANPRIKGEVEVAVKAWQDAAFKQALLTNPKATLEQEFETEFPDDLSVQMVEAQPNHFYLRVPNKAEVADTLSLEDLTQTLVSTEGEMAPIIAKAFKDADFKQALLTNSKATLEQELGVELPENLVVEVLEETANTLIVLLPLPADLTEVELSDEELESVSGGTASILASIGRAVAPSLVATAASSSTAALGTSAAAAAANAAAAGVGRTVLGATAVGTTTVVLGATAGANQVSKFW